MTINDQAAQNVSIVPAKDAWVKPEITSFAAAADANAVNPGVLTDGGGAGANVS